MLAQEEDVEIHALRKQGWSISAIARHTGRDRKTVRAYLSGDRQAGVRVSAVEDGLDRVEPYVRQRLSDDRHVWATVIYDEIGELGSDQSYPTFTRKLRERDLRPRCEACAVVYTAPSGMVVSGISDDGSLVFVGEPLDPTRAAHQESIVLDHRHRTGDWPNPDRALPALQPGLQDGLRVVLRELRAPSPYLLPEMDLCWPPSPAFSSRSPVGGELKDMTGHCALEVRCRTLSCLV